MRVRSTRDGSRSQDAKLHYDAAQPATGRIRSLQSMKSPGPATVLALVLGAGSARGPPARGPEPARDPCAEIGVPSDRCTRWQPGIRGGIPARGSVCATIDGAAFGGGKADASDAIQSAISGCAEGTGAVLPPGTYRLRKSLLLNKGVVLRGAGPDRTRLRLDAEKGPVIFMTNLWPEYNRPAVDVTADVPKGSSAIPVADPGGFAVGDVITIDQLDDPAYVVHGGCRWMKRGPNRGDDRRPVSAAGYRAQGQIAEI